MELESALASAETQKTALPEPLSDKAVSSRADAVVFQGEKQLDIQQLTLIEPGTDDLAVDVHWSGVSTGTERLLWSSDMPPFPGLSYPLVPGYEAVGVVTDAQTHSDWIGKAVFVPGCHCFKEATGVFGGSASKLIVPAERSVLLGDTAGVEDVLLALAATAHHAIKVAEPPELIVGHGVLGRLLARITIALGHTPPTVWEINPERKGREDYPVIAPQSDMRTDYASAYDVSGSVGVIDDIIAHSGKGATIVLAGFYSDRPSFAFPAAFMREVTLKIAAEWTPDDVSAVLALRKTGQLSFDNLVTHSCQPADAASAYDTAFGDPRCLKMVLDWRGSHDNAH